MNKQSNGRSPYYVDAKRSLLSSLQNGGYILYARHGEPTIGNDQPYLNFQDCSTQRNLSELGRRQGVTYGETLRRLHIPIEYPVVVSPFCRNIETGQLAFGVHMVQVDPYWFHIYRLQSGMSVTEQQRILDALQSILEIQPPPRTNKVIIAHSFPKGVGLGEIPYMGTVIVKPHGKGKGYEVVTKLSLQELMGFQS